VKIENRIRIYDQARTLFKGPPLDSVGLGLNAWRRKLDSLSQRELRSLDFFPSSFPPELLVNL